MGLIRIDRVEVSQKPARTNFENLLIGEVFSHGGEIMLKVASVTAFHLTDMRIIMGKDLNHNATRLSATLLWELEYEHVG